MTPLHTLFPLVVVGAAALLTVHAARRPAGATVTREGTDLVVRLPWWEAVLGMRRTVRVPLSQVRSIDVVEPQRGLVRGWRVGTAVPRLIAVGTWRRRGERYFVDVRRGRRWLVVECDPSAPYRRIVLEPADADRMRAELAG